MLNVKKIIILGLIVFNLTSMPVFATSVLSKYSTGWWHNENSWSYLVDGKPLTGLQTINDKIYYLDNTGKIITGWSQYNNNWYYCPVSLIDDITPVLSKTWKNINNKWYYFNTDGTMAHDTTIEGYNVGSNGAWIK
ncbi:hypothetical protein [Clostridium saccharoperbutylacetonicum]|uniref:hypothetical protein n=1 Tax=Clostridium saccharoperbutylacetonicum TaxID=36745 RepID=UPI0039E87C97